MTVIKNTERILVRHPEGAGLLKDQPIGGKELLKWILCFVDCASYYNLCKCKKELFVKVVIYKD